MELAELAEKFARHLHNQNKLSEHFNATELACRHCGKVYVTPVLIEMLEKLRKLAGVSLNINSGYRCPEHNKNIGGSPRSKHCLGMAADIAVPDKYRMNPNEFIEAAEAVALEVRGGYHFYPAGRFVHIDCWPYPQNRRWT